MKTITRAVLDLASVASLLVVIMAGGMLGDWGIALLAGCAGVVAVTMRALVE